MKTKSIKNILLAIFLGAVGSGLWSLAGESVLNWCVETFISIAQSANDGYFDYLHKDIGKAFHEESGEFLRTIYNCFLFIVIIALPFITYKLRKKALSFEGTNGPKQKIDLSKRISLLKKTTKMLFVFTIFYSVIACPFLFSSIIAENYNNTAIVFVERSIEILSPRLKNEEIIQLRADYRSISDAISFYQLFDRLNSIAESEEIILPKFSIAR